MTEPYTPSPLQIHDVVDRGVANRERIYIRVVTPPVSLSRWALIASFGTAPGFAWPITNHFLWLGSMESVVIPWIVVYTGPGPAPAFRQLEGGESALLIYWGCPRTVFNNDSIIPVLVSLHHVEFPPSWRVPAPPSSPSAPQQLPASTGERPPPPPPT